jgi:hypothetical protein
MEIIVQIAEGVFRLESEGLTAYPDGGPSTRLDLERAAGRPINLVAHHVPDPSGAHLPGSGACLLGDHCPRHGIDPSWLLDFRAEGVLTRDGAGWLVGDRRIPLRLLDGHRGRIVFTTTDEPSSLPGGISASDSVEDLASQASELGALLEELRGIVSRT